MKYQDEILPFLEGVSITVDSDYEQFTLEFAQKKHCNCGKPHARVWLNMKSSIILLNEFSVTNKDSFFNVQELFQLLTQTDISDEILLQINTNRRHKQLEELVFNE
jgi:hypothetical protein